MMKLFCRAVDSVGCSPEEGIKGIIGLNGQIDKPGGERSRGLEERYALCGRCEKPAAGTIPHW